MIIVYKFYIIYYQIQILIIIKYIVYNKWTPVANRLKLTVQVYTINTNINLF